VRRAGKPFTAATSRNGRRWSVAAVRGALVYPAAVPLPPSPLEVFLSYASGDDTLRAELEKHLAVLKSEGLVRSFHGGDVRAGDDWKKVTEEHLARADVILLLVSADFVASAQCYEVEVRSALARHEAGQAVVVPVILRDCDWRHASFGHLKALPKDGRPVARALRETVTRLLAERSPASMPARSARMGARTRADKVREVLQALADDRCVGVALLAPLGFQEGEIAGEVLHRLQRPGEVLFPVRLVPELDEPSEEGFYARLLRDLARAVPPSWRPIVEGQKEPSARDRFEYAVEELLAGPVREAGRRLLFAIDGLADVPMPLLRRWGYLMAKLPERGFKLLAWGGRELHELRTMPEAKGRFSAFTKLKALNLGPLSAGEVEERVVERGGTAAAASVVFEETGGHPALVDDLLDGYPEDVQAGEREAIVARILESDHVARLRRTVQADEAAAGLLRAFAGVTQRPWPRKANEERMMWLGVVRDAGATKWDWTAPAMARFAAEWV
jgi:hypothetical protein